MRFPASFLKELDFLIASLRWPASGLQAAVSSSSPTMVS
jgi:hypothetical protein